MLYLIGTPLGNIEDITLRAIKTLIAVEIILCEDTRTFSNFYQKTQQSFQISSKTAQKLLAFHKDNEYQQLPLVLSYLRENKDVALVSESGMPTIADPGSLLLQKVIKDNLAYTVIPGPTALVNALLLSGFPTNNVLFLGFLPKKKSQLLQLFNKLQWIAERLRALTVVFYESPHRINETLRTINETLPEAEVCLCREMTKKFEEVIRGRAQELGEKSYRGEITVVLHFPQKRGGEQNE